MMLETREENPTMDNAARREYSNRISEVSRGFMKSQILMVANAGGVFALLEDPKSAEEVATGLSWSARGTRMLLDALLALEFVSKSDGRYRNLEIASACLVPGRPGYQGDIINHSLNIWQAWSGLGEAVASGKCAARTQGDRSEKDLRDFILGMKNIAVMSAQEMLEAVDLSPYKNLLDVGGGPGTYSMIFLNAHPEMRATLFDLPPTVAIAREQVGQAGLNDRFAFIEGDLYKDDFGSGYDLVLVSNIIHMMSPEATEDLFRKCHEALAPGGMLIVKDFICNNDRSGPPFGLIFALNMLVATEEGGTYTFDEIEQWCANAGFTMGRSVELTEQSHFWLAEKE
jgi:SAM-dependent methyltransferase